MEWQDMPNKQTNFSELPDDGFIRQSQLIPNIVPISGATLWREVKAGTFPAPVKLSQRITAWRVADIRAWTQSRKAASLQGSQ
jgi:prophage regulatory protein